MSDNLLLTSLWLLPLIGTFVGRAIWRDQGYKAGWIFSILGAVLLLILIRYLF